jgi:hypothetical protein
MYNDICKVLVCRYCHHVIGWLQRIGNDAQLIYKRCWSKVGMHDRNPQDFEDETRLNHVDLGGKETPNVPNSRTGILVLHAYKIH